MNILFISAIFPYPLHSGGQVRIYHLLKELSQKHTITLLSFIRDPKEAEASKHLPFLKATHTIMRGKAMQPKYLAKAALTDLPWLLSTYENEHMKKLIQQELDTNTYDLIHIEPFYVYPSVPKSVNIPLVVGEHNIEYAVYEKYQQSMLPKIVSPLASWDVGKMKSWEEKIWKKATAIIAVSESDKAVMERLGNGSKVTVVENGVDTKEFTVSKKNIDSKRPVFLFTGNFSWMPNKESIEVLLHTIWPKVLENFPEATLHIVGKNLPEALQDEVKLLSSVVYKSHVERIQDELLICDALIAPMAIGGGTKFKIIESFAAGVPVITTKEGIMGLPVRDGEQVLIADSSDDFVKKIQYLCSHPKEIQIMVQKARIVVEQYDWKEMGKKMDGVWEKVGGKV